LCFFKHFFSGQGIKKERVPTFLIPLDGSGKPYQKNEEKQSTPYNNKVWTFAAFRPLIEFYQNLPVGTVSSNVLRKMSFRRSDAAKVRNLSLPRPTSCVFSRTALLFCCRPYLSALRLDWAQK